MLPPGWISWEMNRWSKGYFYPAVELRQKPKSFWLSISRGFDSLTPQQQKEVQQELSKLTYQEPTLRASTEVLGSREIRVSSVQRPVLQTAIAAVQKEFPRLKWDHEIECKTFALQFVKVQYDPPLSGEDD